MSDDTTLNAAQQSALGDMPRLFMADRAAEALRSFPLPDQSATSEANYRRILEWLHHGGKNSVAALVIDLGADCNV